MKQKEITKLIDCCVNYFNEANYSPITIGKYQTYWRRGILQFMEEKSLSIYSSDVGAQYIRGCTPQAHIKEYVSCQTSSIRVLDDYLNLGYIRSKTREKKKLNLSGPLKVDAQKLLDDLVLRRCRNTSIDYHKRNLYNFLKYLNLKEIQNPNDITDYHIMGYISNKITNKMSVISTLRILFKFWFEQHIIVEDKTDILKNYKWSKKERIPSYYTPDEVAKIEHSVDRAGSLGKRNYAMLLLASRLGLRSSDISNLKFENINWQNNKIILTQHKTVEPIELPLLTDVGNAIIDYLKLRAKSNSHNIFISTRAPYVNMLSGNVSNVISRIISNAGISIKNRHHGSHSMRHSLASTMLKNGVNIPVISETLGHKHTTSTMNYLKIDTTSLLKCALTVQEVSDEFYTQKRGAFYE